MGHGQVHSGDLRLASSPRLRLRADDARTTDSAQHHGCGADAPPIPGAAGGGTGRRRPEIQARSFDRSEDRITRAREATDDDGHGPERTSPPVHGKRY